MMIPIEVYLKVKERKLQNFMYITNRFRYLIIYNNIDMLIILIIIKDLQDTNSLNKKLLYAK